MRISKAASMEVQAVLTTWSRLLHCRRRLQVGTRDYVSLNGRHVTDRGALRIDREGQRS
jgi:hypothetical protein